MKKHPVTNGKRKWQEYTRACIENVVFNEMEKFVNKTDKTSKAIYKALVNVINEITSDPLTAASRKRPGKTKRRAV